VEKERGNGAGPRYRITHAETAIEGRPYMCPECRNEFKDATDFGPHLERHREMTPPMFSKTGKPRSVECPKGCGRHFPRGSDKAAPGGLQLAEHVINCDGRPRLPDLLDVIRMKERKVPRRHLREEVLRFLKESGNGHDEQGATQQDHVQDREQKHRTRKKIRRRPRLRRRKRVEEVAPDPRREDGLRVPAAEAGGPDPRMLLAPAREVLSPPQDPPGVVEKEDTEEPVEGLVPAPAPEEVELDGLDPLGMRSEEREEREAEAEAAGADQ
jgi:hypothetical protein